MERQRVFPIIGLILMLLALVVWATDRTEVIYATNLNLSSDAHQRGDMLIMAGNVHVPAGAQVDGSLLMLCCNMHVEGTVQGDLELTTGNLLVGSQATVGGAILTAATNVQVEPPAVIEGQRVSLGFWPSFGRTVVLPPALLLLGLILLSSSAFRAIRHKRNTETQAHRATPANGIGWWGDGSGDREM
ncbi:MAG: hypothetical protein AB4911_17105 [Oscillochloridaceae bacterium umkhey_bin13]